MDEYISREETAKAFCEKCRGYYDGHCIHRGECDVDVIQTAPAADVQLVKHGRWIIDYAEGTKIYHAHCSECNKEPARNIGGDYYIDKLSDFCPNCGRKVRPDQKQCDFCRARKRTNAERHRRSLGIMPKQIMCEDETVCSTCGKPVKAGFKVCESCYQHCVDMGQTGRANRKTHYWEKDNRIVFLGGGQ